MGAFLVIMLRVLLIYFAIRLVWSLFSRRENTIESDPRKAAAPKKRFDGRGENIADAEYEDV
ncbi:MAG: hypothetical protein GF418_11575 [Chitinivibrionales bacterium]|nr:hypothetical protein [Chitinivibrionales bacterium]